jgi:hypothetical protein
MAGRPRCREELTAAGGVEGPSGRAGRVERGFSRPDSQDP